MRKDFDDAIRKYYFSAKKNSLRTVYELMILEQYTNGSGGLADEIPSWHSFRHYYDRYWSKSEQKTISRNGLTYYQRNERRLHGNAMNYRTKIGSYQLDETTGDVFLVSKFDRSKVIGRPYIYLAVDTCTQLIAGVYVGLEAGENALLACIANAAADKVSYCAGLGINISEDDWPSRGMPSELITDQGAEFTGTRMTELCIRYGVEINTLPPFRAEEKPLVERAMGLLQDSYTSMLQGKGGIGEDVNERWAIDYRSQAVLTLDEFRKIVIITIINLNAGRLLNSGGSLYSQGPETPSERWKSFYYNGETTLIDVDENELRLRALPRASAKVSRSGIVFNSMRYATPKDYQLKAGEQVEFVYDTEDTSRVFILDAEKNFISCPLVAYAGMMGDADERKRRERDELAHRVKMRSEILQVIADAESQAQGRKDIGVKGNRQKEKERLS